MKIKLIATPQQIEVIRNPARFISVFAGRRWGKSVGLSRNRALTQCLENPGFHYWYIAPTYAQAIEEFKSIAFHPALRPLIKNALQQPYPEVTFINGSRLAYRTFERPNNLRGAKLNELWVDEVQNIKEGDFWPVLRPLISDTQGNLCVSGQFRGNNWYYEQLFLRGQRYKLAEDTYEPTKELNPAYDPAYASYRFPSETGLMFQSLAGREELEIAKSQLPRVVFEQEYDCLPVANQAAVFDAKDIKTITRGEPKTHATPGNTYILGVDLGRTQDYTAIVVLEIQTNTVVHAEKLPLKMKHEDQSQLVFKIASKYGHGDRPALVVIDSTGGATGGKDKIDAYIQFYAKVIRNLKPFHWGASNKQRIIQHLALEIEQKRLSIPAKFAELRQELLMYEYEYRNGWYEYHAPQGKHDDYVSAIAMASWARYLGLGPQTSGLPVGALIG